jgi:putative addiction module component (TIGR02574 family)
MTAELQAVLAAAMALSNSERAELATILTDSLAEEGSSDTEIEAAWIAEAQRRWEDIRSGRSKTVPLEEVTARLRSKLQSARARASMG